MPQDTTKEIAEKSRQRMIDDIKRYGYRAIYRPDNISAPWLVKDGQTSDFLTFRNSHELAAFISGLNWCRAAARGKIEELGR